MEHPRRLAGLVTGFTVTRIEPGMYRVEKDGRVDIVYATVSAGERWAWYDGRAFQEQAPATSATARAGVEAVESLSAPMPATVLKVATAAGRSVKKGETLIVLEAMKMELPLRAPADATVKAIHCREGELVQPDTVLIELS